MEKIILKDETGELYVSLDSDYMDYECRHMSTMISITDPFATRSYCMSKEEVVTLITKLAEQL